MTYTAVVLTDESRARLLNRFSRFIPPGWDVVCHHMTVAMKKHAKSPAAAIDLGREDVVIVVDAVGTLGSIDEPCGVIALRVESAQVSDSDGIHDVESVNETRHITLAVYRAGGWKPKDSNRIERWSSCSPEGVVGTLKECRP